MLSSMVTLLATSCSFFGGGNYTIPSDAGTLVVDLHSFMPGSGGGADLVNITCTKDIADAFREKTGINIRWFTAKSTDGEVEEVSADYIKAIQNGQMPAIGFSWSAFKDRNYYLSLDKYLDTPNEFLSEEEQDLYPTWRDQFPEYVWGGKECSNENGDTIAIPLLLNPGPATGWFYNKTFFEKNNFDIPLTWDEFSETAMEIKSSSSGPFVYSQEARITGWELQFSLGPAFANALSEANDLNHDGEVSESETLEGVLAGRFSPLESENPEYFEVAQACYKMLKQFYTDLLPSNWSTVTASDYWGNTRGDGLLRQNGLWAFKVENGQASQHPNWKYGAFPAPLLSRDSNGTIRGDFGLSKAAQLIKNIETRQIEGVRPTDTMITISRNFIDTINPTPSLYVNLLRNGIYDNQEVLNNAIKFLKFLSLPENISMITEEHQGVLGGPIGSTAGVSLRDWLQQEFPIVPTCKWPDAYIVGNNSAINQALKKYIKDNSATADETFFAVVAQQQKEGATTYKKALDEAQKGDSNE